MSDRKKAPRKQIRADERRRQLLAASLRVMKREGIAAATTRAICAEAGMPHGAFHYCFRSKRELYAALLASDIEIDLDAVWPELSPEADPQENIRKLLLAYWSQVEADPEAQLVLFDLGSFVLRDPELQELPGQEYRASLDRATGYITRLGDEAGLTYLCEEHTLAELVVTTLNGVAWSWLAHRDSAVARASLTQFAELVAGLTRRKAARPV
ncbi:TetR/AcrR family transcriptional regulator [Nocardiopsis algeriensis]|uniref:AcrR family transcriptional regulator n=1 Tax=Nocardiopsis algeriensis TaxID=1478215 RepID=A0A841IMA0_9ACTN|nr:TetR/AcrR family transcriptional regulator [Nocardiopsis algeriensis]MBB6119182.1 AcrR family transcriptional regulator [Nocardiopsis algeriensis]